MKEIGLHGRGGQGVVTAGELLANIYFKEGYEVQFMPSYGAERRGSPSNAYVRVDEKKVLQRYPVRIPDEIIVLNATLLHNLALKESGIALLNLSSNSGLKKNDKVKLFIVDVNKIALECKLGTPVTPHVNTAILGAYCKISGDFSFDSLKKVYEEKLGKMAKLNIEAAEKAYDSVREI